MTFNIITWNFLHLKFWDVAVLRTLVVSTPSENNHRVEYREKVFF